MAQFLSTLWQDEAGQDMSEYALLVALIGIGLITVAIFFRDAIGQVFADTAGGGQGAPEPLWASAPGSRAPVRTASPT